MQEETHSLGRWQYCSQQPKPGNSPTVHQQVKGWTQCGPSIQRNVIQPQKWCYNKDEPWKCYAKWNKPGTKGQLWCDSTDVRCLGQANSHTEKKGQRLSGTGGGRWGGRVYWGQSFSLGSGKLLEMDGGHGGKTVWMHLMPLNCTLKTFKMVILCFIYI